MSKIADEHDFRVTMSTTSDTITSSKEAANGVSEASNGADGDNHDTT